LENSGVLRVTKRTGFLRLIIALHYRSLGISTALVVLIEVGYTGAFFEIKKSEINPATIAMANTMMITSQR